MTLIQIQEQAIAKLDTTRSSPKRYLKWKGAVRRWYTAQVAKIGIVDEKPTYMASATWRDALDMKALRDAAE